MAMTTDEMVSFFQGQTKLFLDGAELTIGSGRIDVAATSFETAFHASLMVALLKWRQLAVAPIADLNSSLEVAERAVERLASARDAASVWRSFDVGPALFLERLVGGGRGLEAFAIPPPEWRSARKERLPQVLDAALASFPLTVEMRFEAAAILEKARRNKRLELLAKTYSNYLSLSDAVAIGDSGEVAGATTLANELFLDRAKNGYFAGGRQTEGGGPDNAYVVDYRARALLIPRPTPRPTHGHGDSPVSSDE